MLTEEQRAERIPAELISVLVFSLSELLGQLGQYFKIEPVIILFPIRGETVASQLLCSKECAIEESTIKLGSLLTGNESVVSNQL